MVTVAFHFVPDFVVERSRSPTWMELTCVAVRVLVAVGGIWVGVLVGVKVAVGVTVGVSVGVGVAV